MYIMKKNQVAMEFLMITGFFLLIIIPTIFYFYSYTQESTIDVELSKAEAVGNAMIETAEKVYYYGRYSRLTLTIDLPAGVTKIETQCEDGSKKCFLYITDFGHKLIFPSDVPIFWEFSDEEKVINADDKDKFVKGRYIIRFDTVYDDLVYTVVTNDPPTDNTLEVEHVNIEIQ